MKRDYRLIDVPYIRIDEAADVLARAMAEDRIITYFVPTETTERYGALRAIFRHSCLARLLSSQPLLAIEWDNRLVACAVLVGTYTPAPTESLKRDRAKLAELLGDGAVGRIEEYRALKNGNLPPRPHLYLQTLGVDPSYHRMGFGTELLRHIYERAVDDKTAAGVMLDTDASKNQIFYERNGYSVASTGKLGDVEIAFMYRAVR